MLYSINNSRPALLPFRIQFPNGFTRTDPATFTPDEIGNAGYLGPYTEPIYDPATQQLLWVNGAYVIETLPPPPPPPPHSPRWVDFGAAVQANLAINQLMGTALQQAPALGLGLGVGLGKAADGDARVFLSSWGIAKQLNLITPQLVTEVTALAQQFDLPADFVAALGPSEN